MALALSTDNADKKLPTFPTVCARRRVPNIRCTDNTLSPIWLPQDVKLAYAFQYGNDLVTYLKSIGFKLQTGYILDSENADIDFTALVSGLSHVLFPVSYYEASKLLDLEHDHDDFYHITINELLFCIVIPHALRGNALYIYHECARSHPADGRLALQRLRSEVEGVPASDDMRFWTRMRATRLDNTNDPAPQLSIIRQLCERHQKLRPYYTDRDCVADLWHILSESAKHSPPRRRHMIRLYRRRAPCSPRFVRYGSVPDPASDRTAAIETADNADLAVV
ncbi:hypothetical protein CYMTET_18530 [Cymbomonas tetramitiformis]|uniref:Uncharacterized protein n=1 Tax=Cymbomonas tetramitiformis TaxID=36881 RepID=A0AAE0G887_9CHLO|nr:hypothetical protein CYMTET_18530 [Cymbomonas tetramitiformis]